MRPNLKKIFYVNVLAHAEYPRVIATRGDVVLDRLEKSTTLEQALPVLNTAHVYQVSSARSDLPAHFMVDKMLIERSPKLLLVSASGAGYDPVDVEACTERGVLVVNQSGANREAVAEHVVGMMLCLSKRIVETDRLMRRQNGIDRNKFLGNDVIGKTVGIIGLGNVGTRVSELCRGLFSMRVLAYDPYVSSDTMKQSGAEKVELAALLQGADYVSVNCPLTKETEGMLGAAQFGLMKPAAYFITTARGLIHDEAALLVALRDKRLAGAGLDVWSKEPPPADHPLLQLDNVVASPHTAGVTQEARANIGRIAAENVLAALDGKRPERILNAEAWPLYQKRFECIMGFLPQ